MQPRYVAKQLTAGDANGIAEAQTLAVAGDVDLDGDFVTGGVATLDTQRRVIVTSAGDDTGITFTITGTMEGGKVIAQTITGANAGAAATTLDFETVTRVTASGATDGDIEVGTNDDGATLWQIVNWHVTPIDIGYLVLVDGTVNFTVQYTMEDPGGTYPNTLSPIPTPVAITALENKSANTAANTTNPYVAWRLQINSGTGRAQACVLQAGIAG